MVNRIVGWLQLPLETESENICLGVCKLRGKSVQPTHVVPVVGQVEAQIIFMEVSQLDAKRGGFELGKPVIG